MNRECRALGAAVQVMHSTIPGVGAHLQTLGCDWTLEMVQGTRYTTIHGSSWYFQLLAEHLSLVSAQYWLNEYILMEHQ